jgi:hypothetical protein
MVAPQRDTGQVSDTTLLKNESMLIRKKEILYLYRFYFST